MSKIAPVEVDRQSTFDRLPFQTDLTQTPVNNNCTIVFLSTGHLKQGMTPNQLAIQYFD